MAAQRAAAGVAGGEAEGLNALSKLRRREAPELPWGTKFVADRPGHFLFGPNLFAPAVAIISLRRK